MRTARLLALFGIAAIVAALVVGCGGDDTTAADSGTNAAGTSDGGNQSQTTTGSEEKEATGAGGEEIPADRAEFIKQADAICEKSDTIQVEAFDAAVQEKPPNKLNKAEKEQLLLDVGLGPVRQQVEELAELEPPEGDEDEVEAIIDAMETALAKAEERPLSINRSATSPFIEVDELSTEYGFKVCSEAL